MNIPDFVGNLTEEEVKRLLFYVLPLRAKGTCFREFPVSTVWDSTDRHEWETPGQPGGPALDTIVKLIASSSSEGQASQA